MAALDAGAAQVSKEEDTIRVGGLTPGLAPAITVRAKEGGACRILLLSQSQAESAWTVSFGGRDRLLLTPDQLDADESAIHLQSTGDPRFAFSLVPELKGPVRGSLPIRSVDGPKGASTFEASAEPANVTVRVIPIRPDGEAPPIKMGPYIDWRHTSVVLEPPDAAFKEAAQWSVRFPSPLPPGNGECFLIVDYVGDMARLYSGSRLLEDNFYDGEPWTIGLRRFAADLDSGPLELDILPLRRDAPIFLERDRRAPAAAAPVATLLKVSVVPSYQVSIATQAH